MESFVAAGVGFLLAVLCFDLMFDVQELRHTDRAVRNRCCLDRLLLPPCDDRGAPDEPTPRPEGLATLVAIVLQLISDDRRRWASVASLVTAADLRPPEGSARASGS